MLWIRGTCTVGALLGAADAEFEPTFADIYEPPCGAARRHMFPSPALDKGPLHPRAALAQRAVRVPASPPAFRRRRPVHSGGTYTT